MTPSLVSTRISLTTSSSSSVSCLLFTTASSASKSDTRSCRFCVSFSLSPTGLDGEARGRDLRTERAGARGRGALSVSSFRNVVFFRC